MYLDEQLQSLIDEAPQHGVPKIVMEKAIAPTLKMFASRLQQGQYYILQSQNGSWVVTTLSNRQNPQDQKQVIYAFSTRQSAMSFLGTVSPNIQMISIPITHLLFQLFSVESIDSILFQETSDQKQQIEIQRVNLHNIMQQELRSLTSTVPPNPNNIPPNLA